MWSDACPSFRPRWSSSKVCGPAWSAVTSPPMWAPLTPCKIATLLILLAQRHLGATNKTLSFLMQSKTATHHKRLPIYSSPISLRLSDFKNVHIPETALRLTVSYWSNECAGRVPALSDLKGRHKINFWAAQDSNRYFKQRLAGQVSVPLPHNLPTSLSSLPHLNSLPFPKILQLPDDW